MVEQSRHKVRVRKKMSGRQGTGFSDELADFAGRVVSQTFKWTGRERVESRIGALTVRAAHRT